MSFQSLLSIILTLFLLMICGYICRKKGIIDTVASKRLSSLIISVGQPMMIIAALNNAEYSEKNLNIAWQVTLISFVMHLIMSLAAFFICRRMKNLNRAKIFEFSLVFANCGFIGFPILDSILGEGIGSFMGAFYVISFHLFIWTWGIFILGRGREDIKLTPKKILLNYGTVPCAIGVVFYLLKPVFELPDFASKFLNYLGNLCTPMSVLITGALLATIALKDMFRDRMLYLHSSIKLIAFPVVICLLAKLCGLNDTYILLATAMA
ncbi:MAG: AEC family transporter, partial [Clostridia bacterium]|nr:AEC family transporter [Clostridia bacterium]